MGGWCFWSGNGGFRVEVRWFLGFGGQSRCTSISCTAFVLTHEKNQPRIGANPALRAPRIGFAFPHSRSLGLIDPTARPFIGNVRANPVAAPAAPLRGFSVYGIKKRIYTLYSICQFTTIHSSAKFVFSVLNPSCLVFSLTVLCKSGPNPFLSTAVISTLIETSAPNFVN